MEVVAIKLKNGKYYAGCNKQDANTLLGAQLYRSEASAKSVAEKSLNFNLHVHSDYSIVKVRLEEV